MFLRSLLVALTLLGAALHAPPSLAQESDDVKLEEDGGETSSDSGDAEEADAAGEGSKAVAEEAAAADKGGASVAEAKGQTYKFVGARYRLILVPKFMIGLFAEGGATVAVHSFGPEFAIRKDGFEYIFAVSYAPYSMEPTPFKSKADPEDAWELAESRLKVLYLTADFLWSHEFSPELALNYGGGAGLGFVFGSLYRTQAYRAGDGTYQPCVMPGSPDTYYCGRDNDHYPAYPGSPRYEEPSWSGGGSKPILFPWLAVQTGLRYKPHPKFATRLDVGFGLSGFFFGLGADYGL